MLPERRIEHAVEALVSAPGVVDEQVEPAVIGPHAVEERQHLRLDPVVAAHDGDALRRRAIWWHAGAPGLLEDHATVAAQVRAVLEICALVRARNCPGLRPVMARNSLVRWAWS